MKFLEELCERLSKLLFYISGAAILLMMLITCIDVVLRLFRYALPGTFELVGFCSAITISFALAHTTIQKGHISVDFIVKLFPKKLQTLIEIITTLLCLYFYSFICYQSFIYANSQRLSETVSLTLQFPFYYIIYGIGVSIFIVCFILIVETIKNIKRIFQK